MTRSRRWHKATQATLLGWAAGFVATSPVQIVEVLRNSGPDFRLLVAALGYGFAVWLLITFAGVVLAWTCLVVPIALFVDEGLLLRHRTGVILASICLGLAAVGYKVHVWGHFEHDGIGLMNFWIYACFVVVFAGITAYYYLRFLAREQGA
jgi:hypothetical protein